MPLCRMCWAVRWPGVLLTCGREVSAHPCGSHNGRGYNAQAVQNITECWRAVHHHRLNTRDPGSQRLSCMLCKYGWIRLFGSLVSSYQRDAASASRMYSAPHSRHHNKRFSSKPGGQRVRCSLMFWTMVYTATGMPPSLVDTQPVSLFVLHTMTIRAGAPLRCASVPM